MGTSENWLRIVAVLAAGAMWTACGSDDTGGSATGGSGGSATGGTGGSATGGSGGSATGGTGGSATGGTGGSATGGSAGAAQCFTKTEGAQADVGRTEPCTAAELGKYRYTCNDTLNQACLPNYNVWTPIVCGAGAPPCTCSAAQCLPGEAAKLVSGEFCACLNLCVVQTKDATCGANGERKCIPIDDTSGTQVFICGGT